MKNFKNIIKEERGVTSVIVTLALAAILGFAALVIDTGMLFIERSRLINAVDAAALAGALELPGKPLKAKEVAIQYAQRNGVPTGNIHVIINGSHTEIHVKASKKVELLFAKTIGFDEGNVIADSTAIIGPVSAVYDGIRPLVVEQQTLVYGQQVVLKENAGDGTSGNYGAVSLGGTGSKVLENNLKYGYNGKLEVGDVVYTETGNIAGPVFDGVDYVTTMDSSTFDNFDKNSIRVWTIPVVDSLEVSGTKPVNIIGFAAFFVESATKQSGQTEITGRFIKFATNGDIDMDQTDYGLKGVKLIQ